MFEPQILPHLLNINHFFFSLAFLCISLHTFDWLTVRFNQMDQNWEKNCQWTESKMSIHNSIFSVFFFFHSRAFTERKNFPFEFIHLLKSIICFRCASTIVYMSICEKFTFKFNRRVEKRNEKPENWILNGLNRICQTSENNKKKTPFNRNGMANNWYGDSFQWL